MEKELEKIFNRLKSILKKFEKPMKPKIDGKKGYDLWSFKKIEAFGRKRDEMYFAGLTIQSKYVGFYFMPVYSDTGIKELIKPELLKTLKGKSCFHIKYLDDTLEKQIKDALDIGYKLYKKRGWV